MVFIQLTGYEDKYEIVSILIFFTDFFLIESSRINAEEGEMKHVIRLIGRQI